MKLKFSMLVEFAFAAVCLAVARESMARGQWIFAIVMVIFALRCAVEGARDLWWLRGGRE